MKGTLLKSEIPEINFISRNRTKKTNKVSSVDPQLNKTAAGSVNSFKIYY
jgi:hypothetical protein